MKQSTGSFGPPVSWGVSIALNLSALVLLGWATSLQRAKPELAELVFDRVTLDQTGAHPVKVVEPKALIRPTPPAREPERVPPHPQAQTPRPAPTESSHTRVETAATPTSQPSDQPTVAPGGNAPVGVPTSSQGSGDGKKPNVEAVPAAPKPAPPVVAPVPVAPVAPPAPTPPPPPPPPPPAKPKGITRDAEPSYMVEPTIPESLLSQNFKKSVRVRVKIAADGSFTVELRQSCGNADVDKLALGALAKWKWRPKLVDGEPQADIQTFRFEFEVRG